MPRLRPPRHADHGVCIRTNGSAINLRHRLQLRHHPRRGLGRRHRHPRCRPHHRRRLHCCLWRRSVTSTCTVALRFGCTVGLSVSQQGTAGLGVGCDLGLGVGCTVDSALASAAPSPLASASSTPLSATASAALSSLAAPLTSALASAALSPSACSARAPAHATPLESALAAPLASILA